MPSREAFFTREEEALVTMSLESTLTDVTNRLRQGRYPNEQAISQGIVLRLLQDLGWDTWDPAIGLARVPDWGGSGGLRSLRTAIEAGRFH